MKKYAPGAFVVMLFALLTTSMTPAFAGTATHGLQQVVIQVSDNNAGKWNLALNNAQNIQHDLGSKNVHVEIVAYGPGLPMLKLDSLVATRVADAIAGGVKVVACENTMRKTKLTKDDMLPNLAYVRSGVPYIMKLQQEGYSYIRP